MSPLEVKITVPPDVPGADVGSAAAAPDAIDGGPAPAGGDVGAVALPTPSPSDEAAIDGGAAPAPDGLPPAGGWPETGAPAVGAFTDGGPAPEPPTGRAASSGEAVS